MEVRAPTRDGFTFVEVVAGILVLSIAIAVISSLISNGILVLRVNGQDLIVQEAAIREMERLKSLPWSQIVLTPTPLAKNFCTNPTGTSTIGGCVTGLEGLGIAQGRVYMDTNCPAGCRRVTVSVSVYGGQVAGLSLARLFQPLVEWFDPVVYAGGNPRSVWRSVTFICPNGLNP